MIESAFDSESWGVIYFKFPLKSVPWWFHLLLSFVVSSQNQWVGKKVTHMYCTILDDMCDQSSVTLNASVGKMCWSWHCKLLDIAVRRKHIFMCNHVSCCMCIVYCVLFAYLQYDLLRHHACVSILMNATDSICVIRNVHKRTVPGIKFVFLFLFSFL